MVSCDVPYRAPTLRPPDVVDPSVPSWRTITSDVAAVVALVLVAVGSLAVPLAVVTRGPEMSQEGATAPDPGCSRTCGPSRYCCPWPTAFVDSTSWSAVGFQVDEATIRAFAATSGQSGSVEGGQIVITNELE